MTSRNGEPIPTLTKPTLTKPTLTKPKEAWQMDDDHSYHQRPTLPTVSTQ
jgi:hypothetical protein